jgi:saccharopine dehydrogenase-like NADP-dependent oxidoreductase
MNPKVLLVGLGMQGKAALYDLVNSGEVAHVVVADSSDEMAALHSYPAEKVSGRKIDARDQAALSALMREADVVVEALPGDFALRMGQLAAESGVPIVSSMYYRGEPGEAEELDRAAKKKGLVILSEFGLDPGLDLILAAKAIAEVGEVREFRTYGAGLPFGKARLNPLQYKFSWSPVGVMRSYRREARVISDGKPLTIEGDRLFEARNCHTLDVPGIGEGLECFPNEDSVHYAELLGIRHSVREMGRYSCRYPGHCAFWDTMVKSRLLDESSAESTAALLSSQKQFQYADDEQDLTFVRVDARGPRHGKTARVVYDLIDYRDLQTGFTSMQRTVGFTLGLGSRLILSGKIAKPGLLTALDVPYESVLPPLEKYRIRVTRWEQ